MERNEKPNSHSLVDEYKDMFDKLEKNGIDPDVLFSGMGGRENFLRDIQDREDNTVNDPEEVFKTAYRENDLRRCVRLVYNIAKDDYFVFKRGLRTVLYSVDNIFPNPLNYNFSVEDYSKMRKILIASANYLRNQSNREKYLQDMAEASIRELAQLYLIYDCFYHDRIENDKRLGKSELLKYSISQIFQTILVFLQSQSDLIKEQSHNELKNHGLVTGFEAQVATKEVTENPNIKISIGDSFEQLLEDTDALFRYVCYLKREDDDHSKEQIKKLDFISPYEDEDISKLLDVCNIDTLLTRTESVFRYRNWQVSLQKDDQKQDVFLFYPLDEEEYKIHIAAKLRRRNNITLRMNEEILKHDYGCSYTMDLKNHYLFTDIVYVAQRIDIHNIEDFHFEIEEYDKLSGYAKPLVEAVKIDCKQYYLKCQFNGITVQEYLNTYIYLHTLAEVYHCAACSYLDSIKPNLDIKEFEKNQKCLVPIVRFEYIIKELSNLYGYSKIKAQKLLESYVFDKKISRNKKYGDIFTRPLVRAGADCIFLSEVLLDQINLDRNIEILLDWNKVPLAPVGKELEYKMKDVLGKAKGISVNSKELKFIAYDGKEVEFDFLATIDDYLILMELKSILNPYDDEELYRRRHKPIAEGVEQIKRRLKVIRNNWDIIRRKADINLPEKRLDDDHIIKIVCTDVGDYTGLVEGGIIFSDDATIIKYFTNPYVSGAVLNQRESKFFNNKILWKNGAPSAEEFIGYLKDPDTMKFIEDCMDMEWKQIPMPRGYKFIAFYDAILKQDPAKHMMEKNGVI